MLFCDDIKQVREIVKEEIPAAAAKGETVDFNEVLTETTKYLEVKIEKAAKDLKIALADVVKDLEAKIKKIASDKPSLVASQQKKGR